jgi:hypothetical protein
MRVLNDWRGYASPLPSRARVSAGGTSSYQGPLCGPTNNNWFCGRRFDVLQGVCFEVGSSMNDDLLLIHSLCLYSYMFSSSLLLGFCLAILIAK